MRIRLGTWAGINDLFSGVSYLSYPIRQILYHSSEENVRCKGFNVSIHGFYGYIA